MTRVSDNSSKFALNFAISKAKQKLEDLQLRGSSLKKITKPSDDPMANIGYLTIRSRLEDHNQYIKNADFALSQMEYTERALEDLTEVMVKAKELAVGQASDFYNDDVRENVSREVRQLKNQALAIANRRLGSKYIFSGYATLTQPFDEFGNYRGDTGRVTLEVSKDFFVPINLNGVEVFYSSVGSKDKAVEPLAPFPAMEIEDNEKEQAPIENESISMGGRGLASVNDGEENSEAKTSFQSEVTENHKQFQSRDNLFNLLGQFTDALENSDSDIVKDLLEKFDSAINRLITLRTRVGAVYNSVINAQGNVEKEKVADTSQQSKIADADVAELYGDLIRQQNILQATYKSGQTVLNKSLLDFLR